MSMTSLMPGVLFKTPGLNQAHTLAEITATPDEIKGKYRRSSLGVEDWPADSPVAQVYDVKYSSSRLILLNNKMPQNHLRVQSAVHRSSVAGPAMVDRSRERRVDSARHFIAHSPKSPRRHIVCLDSSSPCFETLPTHRDGSAGYRRRPVSTNRKENAVSSMPSPSEWHHYTSQASTRGPHYYGYTRHQPKRTGKKKELRPPPGFRWDMSWLQHPDMTLGQKRYMHEIARTYDLTHMKKLKQAQYIQLLYHEQQRAFFTPENYRKYLNYLKSSRQLIFGRNNQSIATTPADLRVDTPTISRYSSPTPPMQTQIDTNQSRSISPREQSSSSPKYDKATKRQHSSQHLQDHASGTRTLEKTSSKDLLLDTTTAAAAAADAAVDAKPRNRPVSAQERMTSLPRVDDSWEQPTAPQLAPMHLTPGRSTRPKSASARGIPAARPPSAKNQHQGNSTKRTIVQNHVQEQDSETRTPEKTKDLPDTTAAGDAELDILESVQEHKTSLPRADGYWEQPPALQKQQEPDGSDLFMTPRGLLDNNGDVIIQPKEKQRSVKPVDRDGSPQSGAEILLVTPSVSHGDESVVLREDTVHSADGTAARLYHERTAQELHGGMSTQTLSKTEAQEKHHEARREHAETSASEGESRAPFEYDVKHQPQENTTAKYALADRLEKEIGDHQDGSSTTAPYASTSEPKQDEGIHFIRNSERDSDVNDEQVFKAKINEVYHGGEQANRDASADHDSEKSLPGQGGTVDVAGIPGSSVLAVHGSSIDHNETLEEN